MLTFASLVLLLNVSTLSAQHQLPAPSLWEKFGDDLEIATLNSETKPFSSSVILVRSALERYRVAVLRAAEFGWQRASVKSLALAGGAAVCINANFFNETGAPLGLVISRGVLQHKLHRGGNTLTGIFQVTRNGMAIINRSSYEGPFALEAVQAGPRLLSQGIPIHGLTDTRTTRRAGICIDQKQRLLFFITSSNLGGLSIQDLQILLTHPEVGCQEALNLDGGGSAQLYISSTAPGTAVGAKEIFISGHHNVPVALALLSGH